MAAEILLGTASWTDRPLIESGKFYPKEAKSPESRLRYYASRFPLVEADTTFYGLPMRATGEAWAQRTPEGFTFDVKAYSLFTEHPSPVVRFPKELQAMLPRELAGKRNLYRKDMPPQLIDYCWSTFIDALAPVHESGKLGAIVFQFPKWVFPNNHTKDYLWQVKDRLGPYRGAVEFRNEVWMQPAERENTLALLGDAGFSYICVDEPQGFKSSVPPVAASTNDLAFVRFHGRNAAMWEKRTETSAARFDYYYRPDELDEWVPKIDLLARQAERVHLIMNTNNADQGPANLSLLEERLAAGGLSTMDWSPRA